MTRFSIIAPHYDGVISDEMFIEGMDSIENSIFRDFEVLIYHDGPVNRPLPELSGYTFEHKFKATKTRYNDWGHSLRDLGIREAKGDYIIHFNPDNLLYPDALGAMDKCIKSLAKYSQGVVDGEVDIVICPIGMEGMIRVSRIGGLENKLFRTEEKDDVLLMDGIPPVYQNIDCMQLVGKRDMWLAVGGWHNKEETSDGLIYQDLCKKYSYTSCGTVMGKHR